MLFRIGFRITAWGYDQLNRVRSILKTWKRVILNLCHTGWNYSLSAFPSRTGDQVRFFLVIEDSVF